MADGDDKKIKGSKSGFMYNDNLGGAGFYDDEVNEGEGVYSISGQRDQKTLVSREAARLKAIQKGWVDASISQEDYNKKVDKFYANKGMTSKQYAAGKKDKQTHTQKLASNVANTSNNNASNGNAGGGTNIATASVGNINVGGSGTTTGSTTSTAPTTPPASSSTSNSTTGTRGMTGNSPFNQATASVGNITINTGGSGAGIPTPDAKPSITGFNSPAGGGAKGNLADIFGGSMPSSLKKRPRGNQPPGRGGASPYQFRGLENQFQSWGLNHYNRQNKTT